MKCPKCGAKVDGKLCTICGTKVTQEKKPIKAKKMVLFTMLALFAATAAVAGVFALNGQVKKQDVLPDEENDQRGGNGSYVRIGQYDALQKLYLAIDFDTGYEEALSMFVQSGLFYEEAEYENSVSGEMVRSVVAAAKEESAKHTSLGGDQLKAEFDENGILTFMTYVTEQSNAVALMYHYGVWFDLTFSKEAASDYEGLYIVDAYAKEDGIDIDYGNGIIKSTKYIRYTNKEDQLAYLFRNA